MCEFGRGADSLLIGRFFGAAAVGLYSRGCILVMRPLEQIVTPINAVLIPVLSRTQGEHDRYRRTFLQVFEVIALIGFLFAGLLLALSYPVTLAVLGRKWQGVHVIALGFTMSVLACRLQ